MLKIVAAAIQHRGKLYQGRRHAEIMVQIWDEWGLEYICQEEQGFVTDTGVFVNRFQAGQIAFDSRQTKKVKDNLLSEDLW
jgi:hypothetical protein